MLRSLKDTKYNVNFDQIAAEKLLQKKLDSMNDVTKKRNSEMITVNFTGNSTLVSY